MTRRTHHALAALIGTALLAGAAHAADSKAEASAQGEFAQRIERRAANVSAKAQGEAQAKLDAVAQKVDAVAAKSGDAKLSSQLAGELGTSPATLLEERADASWGALVIAHRLAASADVPASALLDLHEDGMGWGTIAAGLGFSTSQAVQAATTVAVGSAVNAATGASVGAATASAGIGLGLVR
jgi:hypothetical protein